MARLDDLANVLRSKNAGPYYTTIDILFDEATNYRRTLDSGLLTVENVARLYNLRTDEVYGVYSNDAAQAIKVTIKKRVTADAPDQTDVMGAHQHLPLANLEIPG